MNSNDKKLWLDIYKKADIIYDSKPWEYLNDNNFLCYVKKETGKLYYASILGKGGKYKGLMIVSDDNINDYLMLLNNAFSPIQLLNYQNGIMISYLNKKDIKDDDKIIPRELGITFNDIWITFKEYKKGYLPYNLDVSNLDLLNELLEAYIMLFSYLQNKEIPIPNKDEMLCRYFLDDNKGYNNVTMPVLIPDREFPIINLDMNKYKKRESDDYQYEIEFANFFPVPTGDNYIDNKYKLDLYFIIANVKDKKIVEFKLYNESDNNMNYYYQERIKELLEILKDNIPSKIYVRDEITKSLLSPFEVLFNTTIELRNNLPIVDSFIEMIIKKK